MEDNSKMGTQLRIVGTFNYVDGKFVSIDANRKDFNNGKAIPIPVDQIQNYYPLKAHSSITVGGLLNNLTLRSGETYFVPRAKRIIIEATAERVIFTELRTGTYKPSLYIQKPNGFHQEWLDLMRLKAAGKLEAAQVLAEWEVQFLVGVLAGTGWKGLSLVIGVDLLEEAVTKKKTKATKEAIRALQVLFKFKQELKQTAPTLESVLTDMIWISLLKGQGQHLVPSMLNDPKVAARAAGTIAAQISQQAMDKRLTVSSFIWSILAQVGTKAAMTVPTAISQTIESFTPASPEAAVEKIQEMLATLNIVLSSAEKNAITKELQNNPDKIRRIFEKMIQDMKTSPI